MHNHEAPRTEIRVVLERLRARQPEIETAILARVQAMSGSAKSEDVKHQVELHATVLALVDYALSGLEHGEERSDPIPSVAVAQVRRAARNGVSMDAIVLCYIAGHRLLGEYISDEADRSGLPGHASRQLRRIQESLLEHLVEAIANEHRREVMRVGRSTAQRRRRLVQRLLAGEHIGTGQLDYVLDDAWHVGVIASGVGPSRSSAAWLMALAVNSCSCCVTRRLHGHGSVGTGSSLFLTSNASCPTSGRSCHWRSASRRRGSTAGA